MTVKDIEIGVNQQSMSHGAMSYGEMVGTPVVEVPLSVADDNKMPVTSFERQFDGWGWKRKISSGFARLRFSGTDVLGGEHDEAMLNFARLLSARFVDVEIGPNQIDSRPSRDVQNRVDRYSIFVPLDKSFDNYVFEFFTQRSQNYGDVEFIFKVKKETDEEKIAKIVREYQIYDDDVWLYPAGRKIETVSERMAKAVKIGKRNSWNVSPRMGIMLNADTDE